MLEHADRADAGLVEEVELMVSLDRLSWNPIVSVEQELFLAMLEGRLETRRDAIWVRHDAVTAKAEAGEAALLPVLDELEVLGAEVVSWSGLTGSAQVRLSSDRIDALLAIEGLSHVDEVTADEPAAGYPLGTEVDGTKIDGEELENLLQSTQFYDDGYYGDSDGYIGLTEGDYPEAGNYTRRSHLGFERAWTTVLRPMSTWTMIPCIPTWT